MNRRHTLWTALVLAGTSLGTCGSAWAHHSFALFDKHKMVTLQALVRKVQWSNPHVYLFVEAQDSGGKVKEYTVECTSVIDLTRFGWKRGTIKPGDHVTILMYPLRDGRPGGLFDSAILANGTKMKG